MSIISKIDDYAHNICFGVGDFVRFFYTIIKKTYSKGVKFSLIVLQMKQIGVESLIIIILTGIFTGLSLAFQAYVGFSKFGAEDLVGAIVALGMLRELGPVLAGLMVVARAGSSMAAELGTMQITEQIDALKTLNIDPYTYLIAPRIIASILVMPCLTLFSAICGIGGGYFFCSYILDLNSESYISGISQMIDFSDVAVGLIKACFFGLVFSWVGTYYGYKTSDGARGVGKATTKSVVTGSILILVVNYLLSSILFQTGIG